MHSAHALRQPRPPTHLPHSRPRHPVRRDATRVLAGYFDRPWKGTLDDAVLINLPNGSKVVANNDASTSSTKPTMTAPSAPPPAPPQVSEDQTFGSPIISIVAAAMARKEMDKPSASGSKPAKSTVHRRQSEPAAKSGATSASTSKPKAPSNLSKEVVTKTSAPAPAKAAAKASAVAVTAPLTKSSSSSTSSAATLAAPLTNNNNKRPLDSSPESTPANDRDRRPAKKARKSVPPKHPSKPVSTATSDTSASTSLPITNGRPKKGWKGWVALPDLETSSMEGEGDGEGDKKARAGDNDGTDSSSERTPTPPPTRGRKGWKGWAIASSPPDESKLILIDKVPVIQGRITRSGRSFGERDEHGGTS
ncbi:hypothetical protein BOTBODRAFT_28988 [Botryobasidium botryosum FD-172 SS1]|uniref:Uncharacterized protein n=1 Tax=Botryobasidium botryosum (strain FD-172 SS1) TaxID=930990 RepID=A0A067MSL7_BOTB1|nr:hypothetical protein BOTBODRAFT_28988 [Botryobasidium botryosum FD-172 SS1]